MRIEREGGGGDVQVMIESLSMGVYSRYGEHDTLDEMIRLFAGDVCCFGEGR